MELSEVLRSNPPSSWTVSFLNIPLTHGLDPGKLIPFLPQFLDYNGGFICTFGE